MGNEKGDVREAAGILSVIKCRKGAHDRATGGGDDERGARPEYNDGSTRAEAIVETVSLSGG